jgi:uncharacterized membrane protein
MKNPTRLLVQASLIAAVYAALTLLLQPISFGIIQFRISEALTVLPVLTPAAIPGLFVGCLLSNILGGFGWVDIVFGSLATLLAAWLTWLLRKRWWLAPAPPIVINTLVVGSYIWLLFDRSFPYSLSLGWFALGQAASCVLVGLPLLWFLRRNQALARTLGLSIDQR